MDDAVVSSVVGGSRTRSLHWGRASFSAPDTYYDLLKQAPDAAGQLVSADRHYTLIPANLRSVNDATITRLREVAASAGGQGFTVGVAGQGALEADFSKIAQEDLRKGESVGTAIALIVLIIVFASLVAAILPIVMAHLRDRGRARARCRLSGSSRTSTCSWRTWSP